MKEQLTGILLKSGTNEVEFIEVLIGSVSYGINVSKVQQVFAKSTIDITQVPDNPKGVLGVMYFRNTPITLVDLRDALALSEPLAEAGKDRQMIVVTRFNNVTTGFVVDGVTKIHRTSWNHFEPSSFDFISDFSGFIVGTIKIEDRLVLILDLERLLSDITPQKIDEISVVATSEKQLVSRANVRIVYAEDSRMVRKNTMKFFEDAGFQHVVAFENGAAAFEYIQGLQATAAKEGKTLRDYLDLIVTDIEMPRMDGLTLCKQVKESAPNTHVPSVVVYSSLINQAMSVKCRSVGADEQISKPHGSEIITVVDRLCGITNNG